MSEIHHATDQVKEPAYQASIDQALDEVPQINPPDTMKVLNKLLNTDRGIITSAGENYNNALFGRDSVISSLELMNWNPDVAHEVILTLASMQGIKYEKTSDEEPGRILHESRNYDTWEAGRVKKAIIKTASRLWGAESKGMTTYFSLDSTPLYVKLITEYAKENPDILNETVIRKDEKLVTIEQSMTDAANWIVGHVADSGLVEVGRQNYLGLIHQTWKDSPTGYIHKDGGMANIFEPMAYLTIQALSADCLSAASKLLPEEQHYLAKKWESTADSITAATLNKFWMEDKNYFASAIDKDEEGDERQLEVLQSDVFWTLNSGMYDKLPAEEREKYLTAIVKEMFSDDFLTDAGIRCRAIKHRTRVAGYHGSHAVWPVDTGMAAKGLRRQGFPKLADQLEARIINAINMSGNHYEFFYVMPDGKVLLNLEKAKQKQPNAEILPVQMLPEADIAWTVAAAFDIEARNNTKSDAENEERPDTWETKLEDEILSKIKDIKILETKEELIAAYPEQPNIQLDTLRGNQDMLKMLVRTLGGHAIKSFFGLTPQPQPHHRKQPTRI